jgi:hypothetical protein
MTKGAGWTREPAYKPGDPILPFAPLEELADCENASALARRLGEPRTTIHRWRRCGVRLFTADRLAIHLGYHPSEVWPEWWAVLPAPTVIPDTDPHTC